MVIIFFSGCTTKTEYIYVETRCPKIKILPKVLPINILVESTMLKDGNTSNCICGKYKDNVFNGINQLRSSENYYENNIRNYNEKFTGNNYEQPEK